MNQVTRETILIVDDMPENISILAENSAPDYRVTLHQRPGCAFGGPRETQTRVDPAGCDDARHERLRGMPGTEGHSRDRQHPGDFPHLRQMSAMRKSDSA